MEARFPRGSEAMLLQDLMKATKAAAPCPAQWADMTGDDKKRLCADCKLHVFNLAAVTDEEVRTI